MQVLTKTEFDVIDSRVEDVRASNKNRHMMRVGGMTGFFTAQFVLGYHAIFNVDWLGWDLVEPITYSIGQGSFILGLIYILRNRNADVEYSGLEDVYCEKRQRHWLQKHNIDIKRHAFLGKKLERIEEKLTEVQK